MGEEYIKGRREEVHKSMKSIHLFKYFNLIGLLNLVTEKKWNYVKGQDRGTQYVKKIPYMGLDAKKKITLN